MSLHSIPLSVRFQNAAKATAEGDRRPEGERLTEERALEMIKGFAATASAGLKECGQLWSSGEAERQVQF